MATSPAVIVATTFAERLGSIAYAAYFARWPEVEGRIADEWLISSMSWPAAASIATFAIYAVILRRARRQSEQLAEMTKLLRQTFGRCSRIPERSISEASAGPSPSP